MRRFADRFWSTDWPGETHPEVYYNPRSLEHDGPGGVLHAKTVVADDDVVFITSANLTEAALDRNIEVGLLVRDRALDNIFTERLWRTVKYEEVYLHDYDSPREARQGLTRYFDFYGEERPHQSLDYLTPAQVYFGERTLLN